MESDQNQEDRNRNAFSVDTNLIPQALLDEQTELSGLGLSVFNQDAFEEGVMNQVDQALAKEEQIRLHKILVKELNTIDDDIKLAENDLSHVETAVAKIEDLDSPSRETQRELESVRRQQANKIKQLKTLSVRRQNVLKKIKEFENGVCQKQNDGGEGSTFDQAFQVGNGAKKESNQQRMMRMGEMTPFGTLVQKKPVIPKPGVRFSEYEKSLSGGQAPGVKAKKDFSRYLKRKSLQSTATQDRNGETSRSAESKTDGTKRVEEDSNPQSGKRRNQQKVERQCRSQDRLLEEEDRTDRWDDDLDEGQGYSCGEDDEFVPSKDDFLDDSSDDDEDGKCLSEYSEEEAIMGISSKRKRSKKSTFKRKRPRPLPPYREDQEEEPVRTKVKRDLSIRREKDDADPEHYQERLLKFQKAESKRKKSDWSADDKEGEGEDSGAEFEGGLTVPKSLWRKLYGYQKTGVRWLWELHLQQAGGIVGDEMGLGKTIQTVTFLAALRTSKVRNVNFPYKGLGPTIIVCPTTIMHQWVKEFHKWWPEFRVAILHSSGTFIGSESEMVRSVAKSHGVLVTSYNTLVIHQELILRFNWHYVILDEGHKIRNPDAKVTLCCKQFRTPHRVILSGSPIQNNLKELWSLFDFVFPGKLGTLPDFMQHFSVPIIQGGYSNATQIQVETAYRCACVLRDTINPYLIRRMKADVKANINLPNKNEQVLFCRITDAQRGVYEEYLSSRECNAILQGKFKVFAGLITLRKICNHPDLSTGGPQIFKGDSPSNDPDLGYGFWRRSGKMIVVEALLRLWKKQNCRVLLFTQSKSMLTILERFVQEQGYTYLSMDGTTSIGSRQPLVSQYNNDPSIYLFLLTTRVGGLGVNLTGADRVIIFDPDWNPSTDMQARERAWRIGQTKPVTIYRLLTSGTIEEKIYHRQIFKQFLTNRILKDPKQRRLFQSQQLYDLFTLGSKGNQEGTETSALFAGTGCNVRVPPRQRKVGRNRFDEMMRRKEEEEERRNMMEEGEEEEIPPKQRRRRRRNSVDEMMRREEEDRRNMSEGEEGGREEEENRASTEVGEEEEEVEFDAEEVRQMKEMARRMSRKMEESKKKSDPVSPKENEESLNERIDYSSVRVKEEVVEDVSIETLPQISSTQITTSYTESFSGQNNENNPNCCQTVTLSKSGRGSGEMMGNRSDVPLSPEKVKVEKGKKWKIPVIKRETDSTKSLAEDCDRTSHRSHTQSSKDVSGNVASRRGRDRRTSGDNGDDDVGGDNGDDDVGGDNGDENLDRRRRHSKKKRKRRDARFEGEKIPHLDKHCVAKGGGKEGEGEEERRGDNSEGKRRQEDDYVLRELFKKTGIDGAMKHDKIVDSSRPDYAIVEAEARRVAHEAAMALKRSRRQCQPALAGEPTWTGQHGGHNASKPRFGQKKNSLLLNKGDNSQSGPSTSASTNNEKNPPAKTLPDKETLFDGSTSGNSFLKSKDNSLTSNDLLSKIRSRKRISSTPIDANDDDNDDDFLRPDVHQTLDPKDEELLSDIRDYVAFMARTDGRASTQEIVLNFGTRLPKSDAPKFKAMLKQVCDLNRGVWTLKAEFR